MDIKEKPDGVIVLENLTPSGYRLGPREMLDETHIMLMTKAIAEYHGTVYALKIHERKTFDEIVGSFKSFPFSKPEKNSFDAFYAITLEKMKISAENIKSKDLENVITRLYERYIDKPSSLLQEFLAEDPDFDIIIHGDYNRNNVMFKYPNDEGFENPSSMKMFDFQWVKCASPVLDLSFYLYMNLDPDLFEEKFDDILKFYHDTLVKTFKSISGEKKFDENLPFLSFEKFIQHMENYALYGCLISVWFLPVMLADMKSCKEVEFELNNDMFSEASKRACLASGGQKALERCIKNIQHAYDRGYFKRF